MFTEHLKTSKDAYRRLTTFNDVEGCLHFKDIYTLEPLKIPKDV